MRLEGFKCDECGVTSGEKPGDWQQVQSGRVSKPHGEFPGFTFGQWSEGIHFCSKECLVANTAKWKTR